MVVCAHNSKQRRHHPRGATPQAECDEHAPNAAHAHRARRRPAALACAGSMHAAARGPADRPDQKRYHVSGEAPEYLPAGLGRVTLLPSGRRTRSVHEGAGLGFALTQHAHIVITAVLYTRTTVALALPQAPSHTRRSLPFQGLTAACACPKSPPPQGCPPIPNSGRGVSTYTRYAGRPRLSSLVSRRVRMPIVPFAPVSNSNYLLRYHAISISLTIPIPSHIIRVA